MRTRRELSEYMSYLIREEAKDRKRKFVRCPVMIETPHLTRRLNTDEGMRVMVRAAARTARAGGCPSYPVPDGATPHPRRSNWSSTLEWSGLPLHECMGVEDYAFRNLVNAEGLNVDEVMFLERGTAQDVREYQAQRYLEEMREVLP